MRVRYFNFDGMLVYKAWWNLFAIICDVFGRVELYGYEHIPNGACIITGNHVSFLDPMSMGFFHETEMCAVARDTLMDGKISGAFFRRLNAIPVKRGQSGNLHTFREVLARVKRGVSVIIFPEGTRSPDGNLQSGKPGAGLLAIKSGAPIVPVRSFGYDEVLPRSGILRGGTRIYLCAAAAIVPSEIDPGKDSPDRAQVIVDKIMQRIAEIERPRTWEV